MNSKNSQDLPARMIPIAISAIVIFIFLMVTPTLSHGEKPFFSIALSKFSDEEAAKKEEVKLKNSGNNAFYRKEKNLENGNIEYQVYIEKYNSMEEAIKEAKVLKDLEIISDYLVKQVVDTPIVEEAPSEAPPEGSETPKPANDAEQIPESKIGVTQNNVPAPESKTVEGQATLTAKKDAEAKPPVPEKPAQQKNLTDQKSANDSTLKSENIIPQKQENTSGQIRREPILIQNKTVKQGTVPEKPAEQTTSTDQKATSKEFATGDKTVSKEAPPEIKRDEVAPEKVTPAAVDQTPDTKRSEPEKKMPSTDGVIDQAKGATLQVGACKEEANAAILKKQLLSLGRTAFYRHETSEGIGDIYRIYITGYKTLGEAVKDAKTLVSSGVITGYARVHSEIPAVDIPPKKADTAVTETDGRIYFIHTGSYKEEVNAQRAVASIKESGYKAFYVPEKEPAVTWFRVYIGDFRSEAQAREKGMELLEKGIITYFKPVAITPEEKVTN